MERIQLTGKDRDQWIASRSTVMYKYSETNDDSGKIPLPDTANPYSGLIVLILVVRYEVLSSI